MHIHRLWNGMFGRVGGQYTTQKYDSHFISLVRLEISVRERGTETEDWRRTAILTLTYLFNCVVPYSGRHLALLIIGCVSACDSPWLTVTVVSAFLYNFITPNHSSGCQPLWPAYSCQPAWAADTHASLFSCLHSLDMVKRSKHLFILFFFFFCF